MTDVLTLFAALVVAPAGVVLALLVTFILVRDVRADWRREFQPPVLSVHEQAAADAADAYEAAVFAKELADLADCDVALPEDRDRLRSGALLALMDSRAMLLDADALLKEHQS